MNDPTDDEGSESTWPYSSLLLLGFFGADTPGGKRLAWETAVPAAVFVAATLVLSGVVSQPLPNLVWALAMPACVIAIGWSYSRYMETLDELSRMIQLKAFAFSYGAAMVIAVGVGALVLTYPQIARAPGLLLLLILFVEPLRGAALAYLARKYE
jgi:hypothetical protein